MGSNHQLVDLNIFQPVSTIVKLGAKIFFFSQMLHDMVYLPTFGGTWYMVANMSYFHTYLGKITNLTHIFQLGWFNH